MTKKQTNVVIALVIVAIIGVVVAIGAGVSKSQDKSYNDGFKFGYAIRGSGNAQGQCKYLWNQVGQSSDNQSLWISGCAAGVNS